MGAGPVGAGPVRLPVQTHGGARGCAGEPATMTRRFYKKNIRSNYQHLQMIFYGAIHKGVGLTVPGRSFGLTGTIPPFHPSTEKCPIGCEWELAAGTVSGDRSVWQQASRWLCESHC